MFTTNTSASDKRSELAPFRRTGSGPSSSTKSVRSNAKSTRSSVTAGNPNSSSSRHQSSGNNNSNNNKINTFVQIIPSQLCCISPVRASQHLMECLGSYQWLPLSRYRHAMTATTTSQTAKQQLSEQRQGHRVQPQLPEQHRPKQQQQQLSHQPNESQYGVFRRRFFSGFGHLLVRSIFLLALLQCFTWHSPQVAAAPQSCILCSKSDLPAANNERSRNYEEFVFEHQVTRKQATEALNALNGSFYDGPADDKYYCKSITCSDEVMKYCLGPQFINDHCLCEFGHIDEGLPFIPHTCYVGEKMMKPSMGSCYYYEELKECCCSPALAMQWRHISGSSSLPVRGSFILVASLFSLALASAAGTFA